MRNVHDKLLASSSLISTGSSSGSGFLLLWDKKLYLITARHLLFNEENNFTLVSDEIEISCPLNSVTDLDLRRYKINMQKAKSKYSKKSDVAVVLLGSVEKIKDKQTYSIRHLPYVDQLDKTVNNPVVIIEDKIKMIDDVYLSNDIFIFGFPTSLTAINGHQFFYYDKPLLRKGIVSYINKNDNTIILDCPVYPGNSGGPVFELTVTEKEKVYNLIGVVSKYIPYKQEWRNLRDKITNVEYLNSGFSVATAMDEVILLLDLLSI